MSVAEGYSISVQCDGTHRPGLEVRQEVYGYTKRMAHAELRRLGWRLGPDFTAYCPKCKPPRAPGVKTCRAIEDCPHPQECGKAGGCERNDALRAHGVKGQS